VHSPCEPRILFIMNMITLSKHKTEAYAKKRTTSLKKHGFRVSIFENDDMFEVLVDIDDINDVLEFLKYAVNPYLVIVYNLDRPDLYKRITFRYMDVHVIEQLFKREGKEFIVEDEYAVNTTCDKPETKYVKTEEEPELVEEEPELALDFESTNEKEPDKLVKYTYTFTVHVNKTPIHNSTTTLYSEEACEDWGDRLTQFYKKMFVSKGDNVIFGYNISFQNS